MRGVALLLLLASAVNAEQGTSCDDLEKKVAVTSKKRHMFVQGKQVPLLVQWDGRAPARAAAALLAALLRRGLRYEGVELVQTAEQPLGAAVYSNDTIYDDYKEVLVSPAATQNVSEAPGAGSRRCLGERICALRVAALGPGAAPGALALLAHTAPRTADHCGGVAEWPFYTNETALLRCGFLMENGSAIVFYPSEYATLASRLIARAGALGVLWRARALGHDARPRTQLVEMMNDGKQPFLFLDHEVWLSSPRVVRVQPPGAPLDPVYTVRLANAFALEQFLPDVLHSVLAFSPNHTDIREILEQEASLKNTGVDDTEQAACAWALRNIQRFNSWINQEAKPSYWIAVCICQGSDYHLYRYILRNVYRATKNEVKFKFDFFPYEVNCSDHYSLEQQIYSLQLQRNAMKLVGVVGVGEGGKTAAAQAARSETALVLYETIPDDSWLSDATRVVGGTISQLASAIVRFLSDCDWTRLAVLSDQTSLAKGMYKALHATDCVLRNAQLQSNTPAKIKEHLERLREVDARILFVNTDEDTAVVVLCAGQELGMTHSEGYVWLAREWRAGNHSCGGQKDALADMRLYSLSFWWRGLAPVPGVANHSVNWDLMLRLLTPAEFESYMWPGAGLWPVRAAALADALLLMVAGAAAFLGAHRDRMRDMHGQGTAKLLWDSLNGTVPGLTGDLRASPYSAPEPLVYVDEWSGGSGQPRSLAVWRTAAGGVVGERVEGVCGEISDGGRRCVTMRRYQEADRFFWSCNDWAFLLTALCVLLSAPALLLARRARLSRLRRRERMLKARHAARERRAASALAAHLVDRAALDMRHPLGAGRFGRVCLAMLRAPGRPPRAVAVKALADDATASEEAEFLKEACTLVSLQHEHIVRLVGVCAADGPPLVLMEYAFFGDLAAYLRERRHLAEQPHGDHNEEAEHVSAESLTRLASEAAAALAYLAGKRLVHRDVRAANCLVDDRRALKLADFGMARLTGDSSEYACARRGLFPVLWMAPESLARGVFSAASDVWALGVLMLELVTLGARPYGECSPLAVLRYVQAGGRPPLPPDATIKTIGILLSCWRRSPEQRPSAAAVSLYLRARPGALSAALSPAPPPADIPPHTPTSLDRCPAWSD